MFQQVRIGLSLCNDSFNVVIARQPEQRLTIVLYVIFKKEADYASEAEPTAPE